MMNARSIIATVTLALLAAACSTAPQEPTSSSTPPVAQPAGPRTLGPLSTDVRPAQLFARAPLSVDRTPVAYANVLSPRDLLGAEELPLSTHTDILKIVAAKTASRVDVPVDATDGEAHLFLSPQVSDDATMTAILRDVVVLDPNGVQVNQRAPKNGVQGSQDRVPMSAIELAGHPAGVYQVLLGPTARNYGIAIEGRLPTTGIKLSLKPSTAQHLLGNGAKIDLFLEENGTPITGATVSASLLGPTLANAAALKFQEIGNGRYTANAAVLGEWHDVGAYLADVDVAGVAPSGAAFIRHGRTGFHYGIPTARITNVSTLRTVTDASGLVTGFDVDVDVESRSLDRLEVSAKLAAVGSDGQEHPVAAAFYGAGFDAGTQRATLHFEAGHVRLTGLDGSLVLRDLQLYSVGTNALFYRDGSAQNRTTPAIARSSFKPLTELTPAIKQLIIDGVLRAD